MNKIDQFFFLVEHENQIEKMPKQFLVQTNVLWLHQKIAQSVTNLQYMYHRWTSSTMQNLFR
jgi:hypothetical protein